MDYHIYLDGEKCGELTGAENSLLWKEAKKDARTWLAFVFALAAGTGKFVVFYLQMLGLIGGLAVLMAAMFAPQLQQAISGEEIALAIQHAGICLCFATTLAAVGCLVFAPQMFRAPDVLEREFLRRVRRLKNIRRYGQLEVIGFALPRREAANS
jgi:hypothetical protein